MFDINIIVWVLEIYTSIFSEGYIIGVRNCMKKHLTLYRHIY